MRGYFSVKTHTTSWDKKRPFQLGDLKLRINSNWSLADLTDFTALKMWMRSQSGYNMENEAIHFLVKIRVWKKSYQVRCYYTIFNFLQNLNILAKLSWLSLILFTEELASVNLSLDSNDSEIGRPKRNSSNSMPMTWDPFLGVRKKDYFVCSVILCKCPWN